jgi:RNA polymerase sigma factor (sigma-70 family)
MPYREGRGVRRPETARTDEELVAAARGGPRQQAAAQALWERYHRTLRRFADWWARRHGLRGPDRDEVRQEAALAFLRALARYDSQPRLDRPVASFRTFLRRVVEFHLGRWLYQHRRADGFPPPSVKREAALRDQVAGRFRDTNGVGPPNSQAGDPVAAASWQEDQERLTRVLSGLNEEGRWLWEQLAVGRTLKALAAARAVSIDCLKRWKRRVLAFLAKALA